MAEITRELKRKLGAVLVKIKKQERGFTQDDWQLAKVLDGKGLATLLGPEQGPRITSVGDFHKQAMLSAVSHYVLTGAGEEFVLRHTEDQLLAGRYRLPGETPWYDQWPWKLLWPAIVSVITTLIIYAIKGPADK